ncbi:MAG: ATP-binding protein [Candidatus Kerfeldbacteria bacterium]
MIVAALIVFGLDPLKRVLSLATDRVFFKAKINYQETLRKLSEIVNTELDLNVLTERLQMTLSQELKLKSSSILLLEAFTGEDKFIADFSKGGSDAKPFTLTSDSPLVQYLRKKKHASLIESLERKIEDTPEEKRKPLEDSKTEIERLGAALVAPVFAQDKLNAIIALGPKLSGDSFSDEDLQLIEVLSPQLGSAIQKAKLFEQVRKFGENLKIKVQEATEELRERNVSLVTLQKITTDMTQTLDFNKVSQHIADSVAMELGFVGAILVFLDDDGITLRARAITNTPLTAKVMKMLPKPFSSFVTRIDDTVNKNLAHEVVRNGQIRFSESFAEVISPPVPKMLADGMQKLMRVKTFIVVPIMSEGRAIGAIEVAARRKQEEISEHEIETIKSMADQLGIVSRNLKLFSQIQQTNQKLEEANKHLQVLDQAKSEFVSIASHQLRTPMTGIMGYLSMLVEGDFGKIEPKHLDILRSLLDESQRMIRLINLFLNVSKIEAGKFAIMKRSVHIEDLIEREVRELRKAAEDKKLKLAFIQPKKALPELFIDDDKMQDVLLNLIDNAIKYTAKGSVTVTAEEDDGGVTVSVKDTGIGIKKGDIRELFSKFVRAQGIAQLHPDGSGLGLFIAKSIVEGHGGHIWVESAGERKGSTFSFWLPVRNDTQTVTKTRKP